MEKRNKKGRLAAAGIILIALLLVMTALEARAADEDRLIRGDVLISFKQAPELPINEVQGEILLDAPPDLIWSVLTDYGSYHKIFPNILSSELLSRAENNVRLRMKINNLWPYPDFEYVLDITEDKAAMSFSWTMEEGNLKTYYGSCSLVPFPPDPAKIRVVYIMARDPGWFVPRFSSDLDNRSLVIETLMALRKEVRERKKKLEPGEEAAKIKPQWGKALFWWEKDEKAPLPKEATQPAPGQSREGQPPVLPPPPANPIPPGDGDTAQK